jgi:hypothetical protein
MTHLDDRKADKDMQPFTVREKLSFGFKLVFE